MTAEDMEVFMFTVFDHHDDPVLGLDDLCDLLRLGDPCGGQHVALEFFELSFAQQLAKDIPDITGRTILNSQRNRCRIAPKASQKQAEPDTVLTNFQEHMPADRTPAASTANLNQRTNLEKTFLTRFSRYSRNLGLGRPSGRLVITAAGVKDIFHGLDIVALVLGIFSTARLLPELGEQRHRSLRDPLADVDATLEERHELSFLASLACDYFSSAAAGARPLFSKSLSCQN